NLKAEPGSIVLFLSIRCTNRSEVFWGPDAKDFKSKRWLTVRDVPLASKEIQGHRHVVTFFNGPRTYLGKKFALAEFKGAHNIKNRTRAQAPN
ncbi:hypothetical protein DFH09DRAFT_948526, partial [Mycena vulgaris]